MQASPRRASCTLRLILILALVLVGCDNFGQTKNGDSTSGAKAKSDHELAPKLGPERLMLSEGYSMLYTDAGHLHLSRWILYVKIESDQFDGMVTAIAKYGGELETELKHIAKDYPGVSIDLDPLPELEKRKRWALGKDRAIYFLPIIGHGGREYERTLLIGFANGMNHESYLCEVMAKAEPDAGLKKFLLRTKKHYDNLRDRTTRLLEVEYYKDPNGKSKN